jgi:hypothetical protein
MSIVSLEPVAAARDAPAQRLRATMAGVRLSVTSFGVRKSLTREQKAQAADTFGAEGAYMSAAKKLLDTGHPAFKRVTAVKNQAVQYWRGITLPYPEPGLRLIRQDDLAGFDVQLTSLRAELQEAVSQLDERYAELVAAAQRRLGSLFQPADYPQSLVGLFELSWEFPSVEPPAYLARLSPQLYQEECRRVQARFEEAVRLAEEAFTGELFKLVAHLSERLSGTEDVQPKVFRNSAIENLHEFFERFRHLQLGSDEELSALVDQAQRAIRGLEPQGLRDSAPLRQRVAQELGRVQSQLDELLVDRPRRNILRRPK